MLENIMLSPRGIRSHRMRSVLTMVGIIIGIAAIIIIVAIIDGATAQLKESMVGGTTNNVTLSFYEKETSMFWATEYDTSTSGPIPGITTISDEAYNNVLAVDGVDDATRIYGHEDGSQTVMYLGNSAYSNVYGIDKDYFNISSRRLTAGRLFTARDYEMSNNVAIISDTMAGQLFKNEDAIGKTVQIGNELFTVVGVVTKLVDYSEIQNLGDYYMNVGMLESIAFVPLTSWSGVAGYDDIQNIIIKVNDPDKIVSASTAAAEVLNNALPTSEYEYKSGTLTDDADSLKQITDIASILLIGIASISLLVGGIGVMNIMLVSVTERTREIGLKKALGAKRRVILSQFLTESVVLTSIGGILGVLIGIGISKIIGMIAGLPSAINIGAIALSVGFSMAVGIVFGLVPSIKAANLNPIDALRYE